MAGNPTIDTAHHTPTNLAHILVMFIMNFNTTSHFTVRAKYPAGFLKTAHSSWEQRGQKFIKHAQPELGKIPRMVTPFLHTRKQVNVLGVNN